MPKQKKNFEQALRRLEEIVSMLESGEVDLERSLALFSEGAALLGECQKTLDDAELVIEKLFPVENHKAEEDDDD